MTYLHLFSTLLFTATFTSISCAQPCADSTNVYAFSYGGYDYELVRENKTWQEASICASFRGGLLAEIGSVAENNAIFTEITTNGGITNSNTVAPDGGNGAYVWLGGTDRITEGVWLWHGNAGVGGGSNGQFWQGNASGSAVGGFYNNWGNEPDNYNNQDGLAMSLNGWPLGVAGEWNDVDSDNQLYYLIVFGKNVSTIELENEFKLYPNPVNDVLRIEASIALSEIVIRSCTGAEVMRFDGGSTQSMELDLTSLSQNVYFVELIGVDGTTMVRKLVK